MHTALKRSSSARLPQTVKVRSSNAMKFCDASSSFDIEAVNKRSNSARLPSKKWRAECRSESLLPMRFPMLYCVCHRKKGGQVIRSAPAVQNHLGRPEDLMRQNATLSGNQCPDLRTYLMEMPLGLSLPRQMHLLFESSHDCNHFCNCHETLTLVAL